MPSLKVAIVSPNPRTGSVSWLGPSLIHDLRTSSGSRARDSYKPMPVIRPPKAVWQVAVVRISTSRSVDQECSQSEQCFLAGNVSANSTGTHHVVCFFVSHFCNILKKTYFMRTSVPGQTTAYCSGKNIQYFKKSLKHKPTNKAITKTYQPQIIPTQPTHTYPTKIIPTQPNHTHPTKSYRHIHPTNNISTPTSMPYVERSLLLHLRIRRIERWGKSYTTLPMTDPWEERYIHRYSPTNVDIPVPWDVFLW